jgi:hypothetical protein
MSTVEKESVQIRRCEECEEDLELKKENFACVRGTHANFERICRRCKKTLEAKAKMQALEAAAVEKFIEVGGTGGSDVPHTSEMLESMMRVFGGTNGFANLVAKQYFDCKPGSRLRNSTLEMVTRLATKNTEHGGAKKPMELMTEEELEEQITQRIQNAALFQQSRRIINAAAESTPARDLFVSDGRDQAVAGRVECETGGITEALPADASAEVDARFTSQ